MKFDLFCVWLYYTFVHLEHIQRLHVKYIKLIVEIVFRWRNLLYKSYLDHYTWFLKLCWYPSTALQSSTKQVCVSKLASSL